MKTKRLSQIHSTHTGETNKTLARQPLDNIKTRGKTFVPITHMD